jgi:hypothetical protein
MSRAQAHALAGFVGPDVGPAQTGSPAYTLC